MKQKKEITVGRACSQGSEMSNQTTGILSRMQKFWIALLAISGFLMAGIESNATNQGNGQFWGRKAVPGIVNGQPIYLGLDYSDNYNTATGSVSVTAFCNIYEQQGGLRITLSDNSIFSNSNSITGVNVNGIVHAFYKGFTPNNIMPNATTLFSGSLNHAILTVSNNQYSFVSSSPIWICGINSNGIVPPYVNGNYVLSVAAAYSATTGTTFIFEPWCNPVGAQSLSPYMGLTMLTFNTDGSIATQSYGANNNSFCQSPNGFYSVVDAQAFYDIDGNEKIMLIYVEQPSTFPSNYIGGGTAYSVIFDPVSLSFDTNTIASLPQFQFNGNGTNMPTFPIYGNIVQSTISGDLNINNNILVLESGKSNVIEFPSVWSLLFPVPDWGLNMFWNFALCEYNTSTGQWTAINPSASQGALVFPNENQTLSQAIQVPIINPALPFNYDYSFACGLNTYTVPNTYMNTQDPKNSYSNVVNEVVLAGIGFNGNNLFDILFGDTYAPIYTMSQLAQNQTITMPNPQQTPGYFQNLWTIQGMILGPPPYWPNSFSSLDNATWQNLSNVTVGTQSSVSSAQQSTYQTTFSAGATEKIGFLGFGEKLSYNYSQTTTQSFGTQTTTSVQVGYTFGTTSSTLPPSTQDIMQNGFMFFLAPVFNMQLLQGFAYDYNPNSNSGTATGLSMNGLIPTGAPFAQHSNFDLTNPGNTSAPGNPECFFLSSMQNFPASTNIPEWSNPNNYDWDSPADGEWKVFLKPPETLNCIGTSQTVLYSAQEQTNTSNSQSYTNEVSSSTSISFPIDDIGTSKTTLTVSTQNGWQVQNTNTFTCGTDAGSLGNIPLSAAEGDYTMITVQPYLLQALTNDAPWVPQTYSGALPWCMTWNVIMYEQNSANGSNTGGNGGNPVSASGKISGNSSTKNVEASDASKLAEPKPGKDSYEVKKGKLAYTAIDPKTGKEFDFNMTADDFDYNTGAHLRINNLVIPANSQTGTWKRSKNTWKYSSKMDTHKLTMTVDFDKREWSAKLSKTDLASHVKAISPQIRVELMLNGTKGSRTLVSVLNHKNDYNWAKSFKTEPSRYCLANISVKHSDKKAKGLFKAEGTLPSDLKYFGDIDISVNGSTFHFDVVKSVKNFAFAFASGKLKKFTVNDKTNKAKFSVDLVKKTWSMSIPTESFASNAKTGTKLIRPKGRNSEVQVALSVGGRQVISETFKADAYSVKMANLQNQ